MFNKIFQVVAIIILSVFLTTFAAHASHFDTDLQNLEEQLSGLATAYFKIFLREAWTRINTSTLNLTPVKIGILDTGIDTIHPEFEGVNFGNTPPRARRDFGELGESHGTNVAGIIGANNISAAASYIFPQMNGILGGVKNLNFTLEGRTKSRVPVYTYIDARKEINDLVKSGTQIINISLTSFLCITIFGTEVCNPFAVGGDRLFSGAFERNSDILFIVAAGNENKDANNFTPARLGGVFNNVVSVGATSLSDTRIEPSNFGSAVSISAPGEQVYTPTFFTPPLDPTDYDPNFTDTSASAPMVTGVAGLIKTIKPELTPAQIKQILIETGDPIQTDQPIGPRLNAEKAVCHSLVLNCAPPPPPPPQLHPWPMFQRNARRTSLADVSGPPFATSTDVKIKWQKTVSEFGGLSSPIIGSDGTVYVSVQVSGAVPNLFAFDGQTGQEKWQVSIPGTVGAGIGGFLGGALGPDGTLYVCGLDEGQSKLTAVNPEDGSIKWRFRVGDARICTSPAIGKDGTIYTSVPPPTNAQTAVAVAVNPDGTEKWRHEEFNIATTPPALSGDESQAYVSFRNILTAFHSQTGQILWIQPSPLFFNTFSMVDSAERVFAVSPPDFTGGNGLLSAFSKSGSLLWQKVIGNLKFAALFPNGDILGASGSQLIRLNPQDGSITSIFSLHPDVFNAAGIFSPPIVDKDGIIYLSFADFPASKFGLAAVDMGSANAHWVFETPRSPTGAVFGQDGTIYFSTEDTVFALGP